MDNGKGPVKHDTGSKWLGQGSIFTSDAVITYVDSLVWLGGALQAVEGSRVDIK